MRVHFTLVLLCLLVSTVALAGVPDFVTYSGRLTDGTAWGQSQTVDLTFWLCETPAGDVGDCVWSEVHAGVPVEDGYFSVRLGETEALPKPLPEGLWITVAVEGGAPLGPWEQVGAVPFALKAAEVASTGGDSVLKAMKLALGFSDNPADPNYISDERFALNQRNAMTGDCPPDYERDITGDNAQYIVCKKGQDEMVKVGDFWIDRYEMSVWENPDCTGTQYGTSEGDAHNAGFVRNGSDITKKLYGCSVAGVSPAIWITWFQAQRACTLAGKRLCADAEWQAGAFGTDDQTGGDSQGYCHINDSPSGYLSTGSRSNCISACGAYDMVGNVWEWTADWWGQGGDNDDGDQPADSGFHGDHYGNVDAAQYNGSYDEGNPVFPASGLRGGASNDASGAGVFALYLVYGPAFSYKDIGARCCLR